MHQSKKPAALIWLVGQWRPADSCDHPGGLRQRPRAEARKGLHAPDVAAREQASGPEPGPGPAEEAGGGGGGVGFSARPWAAAASRGLRQRPDPTV